MDAVHFSSVPSMDGDAATRRYATVAQGPQTKLRPDAGRHRQVSLQVRRSTSPTDHGADGRLQELTEMFELLSQLAPLRLGPVTPDTDRCVQILKRELPFNLLEFQSDREFNGWVVPKNWHVKKAEILRDGKLIYDGLSTPMGVIGYSKSFTGRLTLKDLLPHLFYHHSLPDVPVYHCDLYYKQWRDEWGFSVPRSFRDSLSPGVYDVNLQTEFANGTMKVLEYTLPGLTDRKIVFNAHNCHAGQANDDISGIVAGIEVIRRLAALPKLRYTYQLVVAPEHFGTVFYLANLAPEQIRSYAAGIFIEGVGNDNRLAMLESLTSNSAIDRATHLALKHSFAGFERLPFRAVAGNDEIVWEAPGYEVPMIQLTRFPFKEYHSALDTPERISPQKLEETVRAILAIVDLIESNVVMNRKFTGLIALSNPRYDLYIPEGSDPSEDQRLTLENQAKWHRMMNFLMRKFDGKTSALDIAQEYDLPYKAVRSYLQKFKDKGLVDLIPVTI